MPLILIAEAEKMELQDKFLISDVIGTFQLGFQRPTNQKKTLTITTANLPNGKEVSKYRVIRMCVHDLQCIFKIQFTTSNNEQSYIFGHNELQYWGELN